MKYEIASALKVLQSGGLILYPTDTVWGIGCDATNQAAVEKVFQLKKRHESKSLICLVDTVERLHQYVQEVPAVALDILKRASKPTTIIYKNPIHVARNLIAEDHTLGIRVVQHEFCQKLIEKFGKPLVSTSANISGKKTPKSFQEITVEILEGVDYVVNLHPNKKAGKPSAIIKLLDDGTATVLRN